MALDADRFHKSIRRLRTLLKKGSKLLGPADVHDLRTRVRRVESAINAVQLTSHNERQLLKALGRVRKRAGTVRDMDVLTSDLARVSMDQHRDCQTRVIEYLGVERERRARQLRRSIVRHGKDARKRLKRTRKHFEKIAGKKAAAGEPRPQTTAAAMALEISAHLASPAILNRGNLHPYRLKVKELRDVLQTTEGGTNQRFIGALGAAKDAIGDWHDWEKLIAIAEEVLDNEPGCPLLAELRRIARGKYDLAVSATTKMRNEYLKQSHSTKSRSQGYKHEPSPRALKAVAAIAS